MTETINTLIFDEELCRDSEDLMILSDLSISEQEEEERLSRPICGNMSCLNLLVSAAVFSLYAVISLLL